jgi:antitoxin (DNA-binding transcriptional repressor) of toxin-antitoxin stability system
MEAQSISTKELRQNLPQVRRGLARGQRYTVIYRSKPIARLEPMQQYSAGSSANSLRSYAGGFRLQANSNQKLTPEYLKKLAEHKFD